MKAKNLYIFSFFVVAALVTTCYFFIDKQLAFFFYGYKLQQYHWIYVTQQIPEFLIMLAPLFFVVGIILFACKKTALFTPFCLAYPIGVLIANLLKAVLKVVFGRYWPATFKDNNPSLLHDAVYGFNPFHTGISYESFPSGHAATIWAVMAVWWLIYPRLKWLAVVIALSVCLALLILCFHFAGDIIAGSYLGILSGIVSYQIIQKFNYAFGVRKQ